MKVWRDRRGRWFIGIWLSLAVAWWILSTWVGPALIRAGYEERSLRFINDVFEGRAQLDVGRYLAEWTSLTWRGWFLLAAGGVGLPLLWALQGFLSRRVPILWERPALGLGGAIRMGAWMGIGLGFIEYSANQVWFTIVGHWSLWANPHQVWMLPLASGFVLAGLSGLICLILGGRRRRVGALTLFVPVSAVGVFGVIRSIRWSGLHEIAVLLLALGISVSLWRLLRRRQDGFVTLVRRSTAPAVLGVLLLAASLQAVSWFGERRALSGLPDAHEGAPNVLLIVLDTVRAVSMGVYGYGRPTTPNISQLAHSAAVFDSAFATSSWTLPTHGSLFTGRFPHELKTDHITPLDDTYPTLAKVLSEVGYVTGGFVANYSYTSKRTGVDRGFLHYEDFPVSLGVAIRSGWLSHELAKLVPSRLVPRRRPIARKLAEDVNREFLEWLSGVGGRPFFAFLNYWEAHSPYLYFGDHVRRFPPERPPSPPGEPQGRWDDVIDRYDSSIAHMDQQIADLLAALDERGVLHNTIVIITSDHGEHFGENQLTTHGKALYAPSVHVPLLVWAPGKVPPKRIGTPVSIRDAAATILDLTGVHVTPQLPGLSLARYWPQASDAGAGPGTTPLLRDEADEFILMEVDANPLELDPTFPATLGPMKSLLSGEFQYIRNGDGSEELYDLGKDRWQVFDLSDTEAGRKEVARFREELRARGLLNETPGVTLRQ